MFNYFEHGCSMFSAAPVPGNYFHQQQRQQRRGAIPATTPRKKVMYWNRSISQSLVPIGKNYCVCEYAPSAQKKNNNCGTRRSGVYFFTVFWTINGFPLPNKKHLTQSNSIITFTQIIEFECIHNKSF